MKARELMTEAVECISPDTQITEAAQRMKSLDVGFLPVCEKDRLIGTITDRDIVLRVIADGKNPASCKARDVMTEDVLWCYDDQSAEDVGAYMADKEIRRVLILDRQKRLVGVVSIGDLAKRGDEEKAGKAIAEIAEAPPTQAA